MRILDFDGEGRDDLLVASYEGVSLFKPMGKGKTRTWRKIPLAAGEQAMPAKRGSSEVPGDHRALARQRGRGLYAAHRRQRIVEAAGHRCDAGRRTRAGSIHFQEDIDDGLTMGRQVYPVVVDKAMTYINGTALSSTRKHGNSISFIGDRRIAHDGGVELVADVACLPIDTDTCHASGITDFLAVCRLLFEKVIGYGSPCRSG
jgi:hypothetical protein